MSADAVDPTHGQRDRDTEKGGETSTAAVALYPDLNGEGLRAGGFADHLLQHYEVVVAVVNGAPAPPENPVRDGLHVVHSPVTGLAGALPVGYAYASQLGEIVVRMDTNEHPIAVTQTVVAVAEQHGAAVGDPDYGPGTLMPHTPDQFAQRDVFPTLFRHVTGGQIELTGSHGLQAWSRTHLQRVLPTAERLFAEASGEDPMPWGFDAAMVLASLLEGTPAVTVHYKPTEMRNRERARIGSQHECVLRVCLAFLREQERRATTR